MTLARWFLGLALVPLLIPALARAQDKNSDIDFQIVKYDGLKQVVLQNRGKVVVVDFWGTY